MEVDDVRAANAFRNGLAVVGTIGAGKDATVRFDAFTQYSIVIILYMNFPRLWLITCIYIKILTLLSCYMAGSSGVCH